MICPECGEDFDQTVFPVEVATIEKTGRCFACDFEIYIGNRKEKEKKDDRGNDDGGRIDAAATAPAD